MPQDFSKLTDADLQKTIDDAAKQVKAKGLDKTPQGKTALNLSSEYVSPAPAPKSTSQKAAPPIQARPGPSVRGVLDDVFGTGSHEGAIHKGLEFLTGKASAPATDTHAAVKGHPGLIGQAADQITAAPKAVGHTALGMLDVVKGDWKGAQHQKARADRFRDSDINYQMAASAGHTARNIAASLGHALASTGDRITGKPQAAAHHLEAARKLDDETREAVKGLIPFRQQVEDYGQVAADKAAGFHNNGATAIDPRHDQAVAEADNARFRDKQPLLYGLNAGMVAAPFLHMGIGGMRAAASGAEDALSTATRAGDTARAVKAAKTLSAVNKVLALHEKIGNLAGGGHLGGAARQFVHENAIKPVVGSVAGHPLGGAVLDRLGDAHAAFTAPVQDLFPKGPEAIRPGRQNIADRLSAQAKATRKTATRPQGTAPTNGPIPESTFQPTPEDGLNKSRMAAAGARLPSLPPGNDFEVSKYHSNGQGGHQATVRLHDVSGPISRTLSWKDGDDFNALLRQKFRLPEQSPRTAVPQGPHGVMGATDTGAESAQAPGVTGASASVTGPAKGTFSPVQSVASFVPSPEWQEIPQGQPVPPGGAFQMDLRTGKNYGRWPDSPAPPHNQTPGTPPITPEETGYPRPVPQAVSPQATQTPVGGAETSRPVAGAQGVTPGNGSVSGPPTAPMVPDGAAVPRSPQDLRTPLVTPSAEDLAERAANSAARQQGAATSRVKGTTQNMTAGAKNGTMVFETPQHRDLYNLGSRLRNAHGSGFQGKSLNERARIADEIHGTTAKIAQATGLTPDAVRERAYQTHSDARGQMQGFQDGETRQLVDHPGRTPDGFEFRKYDTDRRKPLYTKKAAEVAPQSDDQGGTDFTERDGSHNAESGNEYNKGEEENHGQRINPGGQLDGSALGDTVGHGLGPGLREGDPGGEGRGGSTIGEGQLRQQPEEDHDAPDGLAADHPAAVVKGSRVYVNDAAWKFIGDALGMGDRFQRAEGLAVPPEHATHLANAADDAADRFEEEHPDDPDAASAYREQITSVAYTIEEMAHDDGYAAPVVRITGGQSMGRVKALARHEAYHTASYRYPLSDEGRQAATDRLSDPAHPLHDAFESLTDTLAYRGYPDHKVWDELPAIISGGEHQYTKAGLTEDEAAGLLVEYARQFLQEHPPEALQEVLRGGSKVARDVARDTAKGDIAAPGRKVQGGATPVKAAPAAATSDVTRDGPLTGADTPAFKNWFGASKVVNPDGSPMVVYHSSASPSVFTEFRHTAKDIGFHFGTKGQAKDRADFKALRSPGAVSETPNTYPVYLSIKNPLRLIDHGGWGPEDLQQPLIGSGKFTEKEVRRAMLSSVDPVERTAAVRRLIESKGYDGVVYKNTGEVDGSTAFHESGDLVGLHSLVADHAQDSYMAFHPSQIKSAVGNKGTFDPKNPNIDMSSGPAKGKPGKQPGPGPLTPLDLHIPPKPNKKGPGALDQISDVRKAGLVSSPRTIGKVALSHGAYLATEEASKVSAAVADIVRAGLEKNDRQVLMPNPREMSQAAVKAAFKGAKDAKTILAKGPSSMSGPLWDRVPPEFKANNPILNAWVGHPVRFVSRAHATTYNFLRVFAADRSFQEQSSLAARHEVASGLYPKADFETRRQYWYKNPSVKMTVNAVTAAEEAAFQQDNPLNRAWHSMQAALPAPLRFVGNLMAPITRVPSNVLIATLEYATGVPRAVAEGIYDKHFAKTWGPEEQRKFALNFGRGSVGAALMFMGGYLHHHGLLLMGHNVTAYGPDPDHHDPGGLLIDGKMRLKTGFLAPPGMLLSLGALLSEEEERRSQGQEVNAADEAGTVLKSLTSEQPLVSGMDFYGQLTDAKGLPDFLGAQAGSFVPTAASDLAAQMDPYKRQRHGFMPEIEGRVPGLRQSLPVQRDALGDPVPETNKLFDPLDAGKLGREDSPAVKLMLDDLSRDRPAGGYQSQSPEAEAAYQRRKDLLRRGRAGEDIRGEINGLVSDGKMTPRARKALLKEMRSSPEEAMFRRLKPLDAQSVFGTAVRRDPALAAKMRPLLIKKLRSDIREHPEDRETDRAALLRLLGR